MVGGPQIGEMARTQNQDQDQDQDQEQDQDQDQDQEQEQDQDHQDKGLLTSSCMPVLYPSSPCLFSIPSSSLT